MRVPNSAEENRHPNDVIPKRCSPMEINSLPSGGWTTNSASGVHPLLVPAAICGLIVLASPHVPS